MWRQEWDIEASFRLRIMDYLPNRLLSLWVVLFLTWGTHKYICCNSCLMSLTSSAIPSNTSFERFFRSHPLIHTSETSWIQTVWSNPRPAHREPRNLEIRCSPRSNSDQSISLLQNPEVLMHWYLKLRENASSVPFRRCRVLPSTFRNRCSIDGMFFLYEINLTPNNCDLTV
jgi:hypothetical protein